MAKLEDMVGKSYIIGTGSHYSSEIGFCVEVHKSKNTGTMLKLEVSDCVTWFKESEVTEL